MPKQRPPGIGPHGAAEERQLQQRPFRNAPSPRLRPRLVDAESGKGEEVHRDDGCRDVGRVEEGAEGDGERVHAVRGTRKGLRLGCFFWGVGGERSIVIPAQAGTQGGCERGLANKSWMISRGQGHTGQQAKFTKSGDQQVLAASG